MDAVMALFGLHLPGNFNLTTKARYLLKGANEPDIVIVAEKFIRPGDSVIDIGPMRA